jgi:uncharacterized protein YkwD
VLGVGAGAAVLIAGAVAAFILWGPKGESPASPAAPRGAPVAQSPPAPTQPDKPQPKTPPDTEPMTGPNDPPHPTPPPPPEAPPAPEVPESWKETALADVAPDLGARVVDKLNAARKAAGLAPVAADADASARCAAHAAYLARNAGRIAALEMNVHTQDPQLPGQSDAGRKTAQAAIVALKEPLALIDDWTAAQAHRALILNPNLKTVGIGFAQNTKDQWASVVDLSGAVDRPADDAVIYPAAGQTAVPLYYPGDESPDAVPDQKERVRPSGFPITVSFPSGNHVKDAAAALEDESGRPVDAWLSSPEKPANERFPSAQKNTICLIAKSPLRPGGRYAVQVKAVIDGREWTQAWTFLTADPEELRRDFEDRFVASVNAARERAGLQPLTLDPAPSLACAAHARYLSLNVAVHMNVNPRDETPDWPGYSEEGQEIAGRSIFGLHPGTPEAEVASLMSRLGARALLLEPDLKRISLGSAWTGAVTGAWVMESPQIVEWAESHAPILYPADGQKNVGLLYGLEAPSAVPEEGAGKPAGFPVTVRFPWHKPLDKVTGRLTDAAGQEAPTWLSTPQKTLPGALPFVVCLLPRKPLREGETYTATVMAEFNGQPWTKTWSFTTRTIGDIDAAAVDARVLARVNEVRKQAGLRPVEMDGALSHGCQLHARYLVLNQGKPAAERVGAENEDKTLPGATPEGAKAGKASLIVITADPVESVDAWMRMLFHRIPILAPDLRKIGFGCAQQAGEGWVCVMDVGNGK